MFCLEQQLYYGMIKFGYSLSTEQLTPQELIKLAKEAEENEFDFLMLSDHYHPWTDSQGQSAFVWSIIGGIAAVTDRIKVGTGVTAPILRYHPATMAQAAATAAVLMPGRFIFGVGTGENLNEHVVGFGWPKYLVRKEMLEVAISIIRLLWQGGYQNHEGNHYTLDNARLYTLPEELPPIIVSAYGPKSARMAGEIGDGFITTAPATKLIDKFESAGGQGKPKYGQLTVCYDQDEQRAIKTAHKMWGFSALPSPLNTELEIPAYFENAMEMVSEADVAKSIVCGPRLEKYLEKIQEYIDAGFDHIYLNQVGHNQAEFMQFYKEQIIPNIKP